MGTLRLGTHQTDQPDREQWDTQHRDTRTYLRVHVGEEQLQGSVDEAAEPIQHDSVDVGHVVLPYPRGHVSPEQICVLLPPETTSACQ